MTIEMPSGTLASWCWPVSAPRGVGDGDGEGDGEGAGGGWVTNVIVFGAASCWPVAVLAPTPMVTWYWVWGARFRLVGWTDSVFACHQEATVVAGVIWTADSGEGRSIAWLTMTRIG